MKVRIALIGLIMTLLPLSAGRAEQLVEIVQQQGLLQVGGFSQAVIMSYDYTGHSTSSSTSSTTHQFKEKYHIATELALLDTDLLYLMPSVDLWLDQTKASGRSDAVLYAYSVGGVAFNAAPYPITLLNAQSVNNVVNPYTPSVTQTMNTNQLSARLKNQYIPLRFEFINVKLSSESAGQRSNSKITSLSLNASNSILDVSNTELNVSLGTSSSTASGQAEVENHDSAMTLSNTVSLDSQKRYSLSSSVQAQSSKQDRAPQSRLQVSESLNCSFGKALKGNLNVLYSDDETVNLENKTQQTTTRSINSFLSHRLFNSLDTRISGIYRISDLLQGTDKNYGGGLSFTYTKKLPDESDIRVSVGGEHLIVDRNAAMGTQVISNERYPVIQQGEVITLSTSGLLVSVSRVGSKSLPGLPAPDKIYQEGRDYTVDTVLRQVILKRSDTEGGTIEIPTELFITYAIRIDPVIKYSNDTKNVSAVLSLFENRYKLSATYSEQDQNLIEGTPTNVGFYSSRSGRLIAEANYLPHVFRAEFADYRAGTSQYSYYEGSWFYNQNDGASSTTMHLRDRVTQYSATNSLSNSSRDNTAEAGVSYRRLISNWGQSSAAVNYVNTASDAPMTHYLYGRADISARFGKLTFTTYAQTVLRFAPSGDTTDNTFHFEFTRDF